MQIREPIVAKTATLTDQANRKRRPLQNAAVASRTARTFPVTERGVSSLAIELHALEEAAGEDDGGWLCIA